ncbi:MAG TPA: hypothetical protein VGI92_06475 [Gemmatimonadales bacterium]|jgi:cation:H+ antiporter
MIVKPLGAAALRVSAAAAGVASALWTFPSMLLSAFLVTWGAEAAETLVSQGLALAVLAWLQTLPEFAVEAVIAWNAGRHPEAAHLAIANLTGAIRLLIGVGWPMIYFVAAFSGRKKHGALPAIIMAREHAITVMGLVPPLLWFVVIWIRKSLGPLDSAVLITCYAVYLAILWRCPPREEHDEAGEPRIARWARKLGGARSVLAILLLFGAGGALLYVTAHPFVDAMLALAAMLGINQFVAVQWFAPLLSEFPEGVSTFTWARRVTRAPTALMNLASSNINQWTILAASIPLIFGWSHQRAFGVFVPFTFDVEQQIEIGLTVAQSLLGTLLLMKLRFTWVDATSLFLLWLAQFVVPSWRYPISFVYLGWCGLQMLLFIFRVQKLEAAHVFVTVLRETAARRSRAG